MIKSFVTNNIGENCHIFSSGNGEAVIIDCGAYSERQWELIKQYIDKEGLTLKYALQTHAHFDHIYGLCFVERDFGLKPFIHTADKQLYEHADDTCMALMGVPFPNPQPEIGRLLQDGDKLLLGECTIEVIHTPGHTHGGVCFYIPEEGVLFSGDTLFQGSIGRTDFPGGDYETELSSIRNSLFTLPPHTKVYPGHGPSTTIDYEMKYNPYF